MRPLNRPMFRYGGPIKEGIMSGIRENYKRAGLVGDPAYPRTNGREHHARIKAASKLPVVGGFIDKTRGWMPKVGQKIKHWWSGDPSRYGVPQATGVKQKIAGHFAGSGTAPILTNRYYWEKGVKPAAGGLMWAGKKALPYATTGGLVLSGGIWLWPDGTPATTEEIKKNVKTSGPGKVPGANSDLYWQDPEKAKLRAEKLRNERIQKYRDIMDIKGMNKRAAYDSLIDASKIIQESGDFKGDIKSGNLINQIIQGASKAFDKPRATKDAIDTLILKGEIEKDIKSSMPTEAEKTAAAFGISKEDYKKKLLGKSSAAEIIANISTKTGRVDSTTVASGYKAAGIVPKATIADTIVDEWLEDKDGKTEIDYVKEVISKADGFGPGLYVVGDRAILFDGTNYSYDY